MWQKEPKPLGGGGGQGRSQLCLPLPGREALPFPYLKQEELANTPERRSPAPCSSMCSAQPPRRL